MADKGMMTAPPRPGMPMSLRFAFFMLFVTALVFLPTTIVFSISMIPTLVAAVIDSHRQKTAWLTVGALNLAGTVPILFNLWDNGHTIPAAFSLISNPVSLMVAYGASAVGWMIYYNVTPLVATFVLSKNERRLREIDKIQKELIKKWGEGVTGG